MPSVSPAVSAPSSAAPASASPTASPEPTADATEAGAANSIAAALVAALASDPLVTHLEQTASAVTTNGTETASVDVTLVGDISGRDIDIHITASGDQVLDQELVVAGDSAYAREAGGVWQTGSRSALESTVNGLISNVRLVDDASLLRYVGAEEKDDRPAHHFVAEGLIPYLPASGGSGQYDTFHIWTEADGTPVRFEGTFSATDSSGNDVTGTLDLAFSQFGGPIEIAAPEDAPAPQ